MSQASQRPKMKGLTNSKVLLHACAVTCKRDDGEKAKLRLAQRGVNINPIAPYGYLKSSGDKHRIIPNPQAAPTVQRIFTLVANGTSTANFTLNVYAHASERMMTDTADRMQGYYDGLGANRKK